MECTSDGCVRGIHSDRENGVADGVDKKSGIGDGMLYLVDCVEHLHSDGDLLLGGG